MIRRMSADECSTLRAHYQEMRLFPGPAKEARDTVLRLLDELDRIRIAEPLRGVAVRATAPRIPLAPPASDELWTELDALRKLVEADDPADTDTNMRISYRLLEITEDAGSATGAWLQTMMGDGSYTVEDVAGALADTALDALIALSTLRTDAPRFFLRRAKDLVVTLTPEIEEESETDDEA